MKDPDLTSTTPTAPEPYHAEMRRLGKAATKVFMSLIAGIPVGDAKKIDNARGAFMAVSVDHLGGTRGAAFYAVAHRYEVNGDLVPDPDVEFYVVDDPALPGAKAIYPPPSITVRSAITGTSTSTVTVNRPASRGLSRPSGSRAFQVDMRWSSRRGPGSHAAHSGRVRARAARRPLVRRRLRENYRRGRIHLPRRALPRARWARNADRRHRRADFGHSLLYPCLRPPLSGRDSHVTTSLGNDDPDAWSIPRLQPERWPNWRRAGAEKVGDVN